MRKSRVALFVHDVDLALLLPMAASPLPDAHTHDNWPHMNDGHNGDSLLAAADPSGQNGGPPPDDRQPSNDGVNHSFGGSAMGDDGGPPPPPGNVIFREKQVKVVRSFLV